MLFTGAALPFSWHFSFYIFALVLVVLHFCAFFNVVRNCAVLVKKRKITTTTNNYTQQEQNTMNNIPSVCLIPSANNFSFWTIVKILERLGKPTFWRFSCRSLWWNCHWPHTTRSIDRHYLQNIVAEKNGVLSVDSFVPQTYVHCHCHLPFSGRRKTVFSFNGT